jgi:serine/threonine protein phosphatase PrpC
MIVPAGYRVGVASHTGLVRLHNEDDYLLGSLLAGPGMLLAAIADGMGGVAGGAEASRIALRSFGACVLEEASTEPLAERMAHGFAAACAQVGAQAAAVPALRGMGTTLTALCFVDRRAHLLHVGDTRAYLRRRGNLQQQTVDHAAREPDNLLLRCIGGGLVAVQPDILELPVRNGDRFLLLSDGVWGVVAGDRLRELAAEPEPQNAAERLVAAALDAGGPDNATAVVIDIVPAGDGAPTAIDLPGRERPGLASFWPAPVPLQPPRWPWLLLALAVAMAALALLRGAWGIDGVAWLLQRWG